MRNSLFYLMVLLIGLLFLSSAYAQNTTNPYNFNTTTFATQQSTSTTKQNTTNPYNFNTTTFATQQSTSTTQQYTTTTTNQFQSFNSYQVCISLTLSNGVTTYAIGEKDARFKNIPGVSLICKIKCYASLACGLITGDVAWYMNVTGSLISMKITTPLYYDSVSQELYSYLNESRWAPNINNIFFCQIYPLFNDVPQQNMNIVTNQFYAGLELKLTDTNGESKTHRYCDKTEVNLQLKEGDDKHAQIDVSSTIPILCKKDYETCGLDILMVKDSNDDDDKVRTRDCDDSGECGGCRRHVKEQEEADSENKASYKIHPTVEDQNTQKRKNLTFNLKPSEDDELESSFIKDLLVPTIKIDYVPQNKSIVQAYSLNDPHLRTYDGTNIEFHGRDGEYVALENEYSSLRVHTITKSCNLIFGRGLASHVYCNYALYIQSLDDLIYFTYASPNTLFYKDLSKSNSNPVKLFFDLKSGFATIPKSTALKVSIEDSLFKIVTHFATTIKVHKTVGNYYIYPSKFDFGRIYGLLGNYNSNKSDELTNTKCGTVQTLNAYFECYRVNNTKNFTRPEFTKNQYYSFTSQQIKSVGSVNKTLIKYCKCSNNITQTSFSCSNGLKQENNKDKKIKKSQLFNDKTTITNMNVLEDLTKKSLVFDSINIKSDNDQSRFKRAASGSSCVTVLNITIFQECHQKSLIDLPELINLCELDVNDTGIDEWSQTYYENALDSCKTKLISDMNNFIITANGTTEPQMTVLAKLCPNNCNNNGNCSEGVCTCFPSFGGFDCSINTSTPLRIYNSSSINDICSSNTSSSCLDVLFLVNRITSDLVASYDVLYKTTSGAFQVLDKQSSSVYMMSDNIIYTALYNKTKIPTGSLSIYYFNITIVDNSTSNSIIYSIIRDECHECTDSINCNIKPNKCDIDSVCYNANDKNPYDPTKICDPSKNALMWSNAFLIQINLKLTILLVLVIGFINF